MLLPRGQAAVWSHANRGQVEGCGGQRPPISSTCLYPSPSSLHARHLTERQQSAQLQDARGPVLVVAEWAPDRGARPLGTASSGDQAGASSSDLPNIESEISGGLLPASVSTGAGLHTQRSVRAYEEVEHRVRDVLQPYWCLGRGGRSIQGPARPRRTPLYEPAPPQAEATSTACEEGGQGVAGRAQESLTALLQQSAPLLQRISRLDLLQLLAALQPLSGASSRTLLPEGWGVGLRDATLAHLPHSDAAEAFSFASGLSNLHINITQSWLDAACEPLCAQLQQLSASQAVELLLCLRQARESSGTSPRSSLLPRLMAMLLPDLHQLASHELVSLLHACAGLKHAPSAPVVQEALQLLSRPHALLALSGHHACLLAHAAVTLRLQQLRQYRPLWQSLALCLAQSALTLEPARAAHALLHIEKLMRPQQLPHALVAAFIQATASRGPAEFDTPAAIAPTLQALAKCYRSRSISDDDVSTSSGGAATPRMPLAAAFAACCERAVGCITRGGLERMNTHELAFSLQALATLCTPRSAAAPHSSDGLGLKAWSLSPSVLYAAQEPLLPALSSLAAVPLSNTLFALAQLRVPLAAPLRLELLRCTFHSLGHLNAQDLTSVVHSLTHLRCRPDPFWINAYLGSTFEQMSSFGPHQLPTLLASISQLGYRPGGTWLQHCLTEAAPQLPAFSAKQLSGFLVGLSHLGACPPPHWLQAACQAQAPQLPRYNATELAALAAALARVHTTLQRQKRAQGEQQQGEQQQGQRQALDASGEVVDGWARQLCVHARPQLPCGAPADLSKLLWGLAAQGCDPGSEWVQEHQRCFEATLGHCSLSDVVQVCAARARMPQHPLSQAACCLLMRRALQLLLLQPHTHAATASRTGIYAGGVGGVADGANAEASAVASLFASLSQLLPASSPSADRMAGAVPAPSSRAARGNKAGSGAAGSESVNGLLDQLVVATQPLLLRAAPRQLVLLLRSIAALSPAVLQPRGKGKGAQPSGPGQELRGAMLLACHRQLQHLGPKPLADTLSSLATLGIYPGARWLSSLENVLEMRFEEFGDGVRQQAQARAAATAAGGSSVITTDDDRNAADADDAGGASSSQQQLLRAEDFMPMHSKALLLWAIASMSRLPGARPPSVGLLRLLLPSLDQLDTLTLLARSATRGASSASAGGSGMYYAAAAGAAGAEAWGHLPQLLWAFAMLRVRPPRHYLAALTSVSYACMPMLSGKALSSMAWSVNAMGLRPAMFWQQRLCACLAERTDPQLLAQQHQQGHAASAAPAQALSPGGMAAAVAAFGRWHRGGSLAVRRQQAQGDASQQGDPRPVEAAAGVTHGSDSTAVSTSTSASTQSSSSSYRLLLLPPHRRRQLIRLALRHSAAHIARYSPSDMCTLLWGLVRLGEAPPLRVPAPWAKRALVSPSESDAPAQGDAPATGVSASSGAARGSYAAASAALLPPPRLVLRPQPSPRAKLPQAARRVGAPERPWRVRTAARSRAGAAGLELPRQWCAAFTPRSLAMLARAPSEDCRVALLVALARLGFVAVPPPALDAAAVPAAAPTASTATGAAVPAVPAAAAVLEGSGTLGGEDSASAHAHGPTHAPQQPVGNGGSSASSAQLEWVRSAEALCIVAGRHASRHASVAAAVACLAQGAHLAQQRQQQQQQQQR